MSGAVGVAVGATAAPVQGGRVQRQVPGARTRRPRRQVRHAPAADRRDALAPGRAAAAAAVQDVRDHESGPRAGRLRHLAPDCRRVLLMMVHRHASHRRLDDALVPTPHLRRARRRLQAAEAAGQRYGGRNFECTSPRSDQKFSYSTDNGYFQIRFSYRCCNSSDTNKTTRGAKFRKMTEVRH